MKQLTPCVVTCDLCSEECTPEKGCFECPQCKANFTPIRALAVEHLLECLGITVSCPYEPGGCKIQVQYRDFADHKQSCPHRPISYKGFDVWPNDLLERMYEVTTNVMAESLNKGNEYFICIFFNTSNEEMICNVGSGVLHLAFRAFYAECCCTLEICGYSEICSFDFEVIGPRGQKRYNIEPVSDIRDFACPKMQTIVRGPEDLDQSCLVSVDEEGKKFVRVRIKVY